MESLTRSVVVLLVAATQVCQASPVPKRVEREGVIYEVVEAKPQHLRVLWKDSKGAPLRQFSAAAAYLRDQGETPLIMMNGGIFEADGRPSGLLVQEGKLLQPVNRSDGKGNFFLKPNGILEIAHGQARIVDTVEHRAEGPGVTYAVQSGPLLLKAGRIHPSFNKESNSRLHRNGVGVTAQGNVVLAITAFDSTRRPNLYEIGRAHV